MRPATIVIYPSGVFVPNRIAVAFVAELRVYGFWILKGRFAELLRILERKSGNGLASVAEFARRIWLRGDDGPR